MEFVLNLLKDAANAFFTALAVALATRLANVQIKKDKRKSTPRRNEAKGWTS